MARKLLFINQTQFGYNIDYFQYCKYLKSDFDITYLCWNYEQNPVKIKEEGINVQYINRSGNILQRNFRFINGAINLVKRQQYYCIFIHYFRGCSIIPLIYNRKQRIHLDIRTGSILLTSTQRFIYNLILRFESYFFKSVSIISDGLKKLLKVPRNAYILPLGADPLIVNRQTEHKLSLLYIGTLTNRRIENTVKGLSLFIEKRPEADIHYTIIGNGWGSELEQLSNLIKEYELDKHVALKGYIQHNELKQYFEKANVGISYIPITPWYEYQPTTKTFEYLMAGMPVIATGTYENKKIVNEQNGIIITDNPESFANSLELLYDKIDDFNDSLIRESVVEYKWETIVSKLKEFIVTSSKN